MAAVVGTALYGLMDRVPGLCYVATKFAHFNYLPLLPLETWLVREGSEYDKRFQGKRLRISFKSILLGYFRGWVGGAAVILFLLTGLATPPLLGLPQDGWGVLAFVVCLVVGILGPLFVVSTTGRWWWVMQGLLHLWSAGVWVLTNQGANLPFPVSDFEPILPWANWALLACSLTRVFNRPSLARAYYLGHLLGVDEDTVDDYLAGQADRMPVPGTPRPAGVPDHGRGIPLNPDNANSDKLPLRTMYLVSPDCPKCGGTEYKRARARTALSFADDRVCKDCGTRYSPPTPAWGRALFALLGLGLLACSIVPILFLPKGDPRNYEAIICFLTGGLVACFVLMYIAFTSK
jgi:hypothetical protein